MLRVLTVILPTLRIESDFRFNRFQDLISGFDRDSWSWGESFDAQLYRQWSLGGAFRRTVYESRNVETAPPPIEPPIEPEPGGWVCSDNGAPPEWRRDGIRFGGGGRDRRGAQDCYFQLPDDSFPPDPPSGAVDTFTRDQYWLNSTWTPTAYISLNGSWSLFDQGTGKNTNQTYSLSYTPGPRLSVFASYREFTNEDNAFGTGTSTTTGAESVSVNYRFRKHVVVFGNVSKSWTEGRSGIRNEVNTARVGVRIFF
jgi:hypothetical protein